MVTAALHAVDRQSSTLTVRLVDEAEMASLNQQFRGRSGPTNVLSFAFESPPGVPELADALGDVDLYATGRKKKPLSNKKQLQIISHLTVHGVLHLSGFDHETSAQAEERWKLWRSRYLLRWVFKILIGPVSLFRER